MLSSFRDSSKKQYDTYLRQYFEFYNGVLDVNPHKLICFLTSLYERGVGYSGINTARSALSSASSMLGGVKVGQDAMVCRFMRGIFNLKPSLPRYTVTWDPDVALKFLAVDSSKLLLLEFSRKVVFLITLLAGQRIDTVANLRIEDLSFTDSSLTIYVRRVKQSRPGVNQKPLVFKTCKDCPNLCVVKQLK